MIDWFMSLDMDIQLFIASAAGVIVGSIFILFGEVVTSEDKI